MNKKKICIITESKSSQTPESFVKAHKDLLEGEIHFLYGSTLPLYSEKYGDIALYPSFFDKLLQKLKIKKYSNPIVRGIKHYLISENIELVLAEYGTTGAQVFSICEHLEIPLIVHFHGYDASRYDLIEWHKDLYPKMFEYASGLIAVSEDMKKDLINLGANEDKIVVNPYGPNNSFLKLNPDYFSNNFLAVGRFIDKKAPYNTIMAFNEVQKTFPQLKLVMLGGGYLLNSSKNLVKLLKLEDKIKILGKIEHSELLKYFENAFCFVQHSVIADDGDSEGTPVAILEAQASGLPIISTYHKGIKEAVIHKETGYLVNEYDVSNMINYMKKLAADRELCQNMGKRAKEHIEQNYLMVKHIDTINEFIKKILSNE
ncbi:glycosyltransferase [Winogradskyella sp.]|nr:glycosyltransferase [Winogradskyella sp.]